MCQIQVGTDLGGRCHCGIRGVGAGLGKLGDRCAGVGPLGAGWS